MPTFLPVGQRFAQQHVGFVAAFLRLEIIRFVEIHRIDLLQVDEILDVDGLGRLEIDALKILVVQDDELPFFVFVAFHDLVPRNFLAVLLRDAFVIDRAVILRSQQAEFQLFLPRRRIKRDRDIDEAKTDTALPDCTHT